MPHKRLWSWWKRHRGFVWFDTYTGGEWRRG